MDRLTFEGNFCDIAQCRELPCPYNGSCTQRQVWERLKAYEDGCAVIPPCKVGEIVWYKTYIDNGSTCIGVQPHKVKRIDVRVITDGDVIDTEIPAEQFGRTAFLSRKEAKRAQEEKRDG